MINVEIPGVKKEDVSIEVRENILMLRGKSAADTEIREENYYRRERNFGAFQRSFTFLRLLSRTKSERNSETGSWKSKFPSLKNPSPDRLLSG